MECKLQAIVATKRMKMPKIQWINRHCFIFIEIKQIKEKRQAFNGKADMYIAYGDKNPIGFSLGQLSNFIFRKCEISLKFNI